MRLVVAAALTATGCGRFAFELLDVTGDAADAPTDALAAFEAPSLIAELAGNDDDDDPGITGDGLELYFGSNRATGTNIRDIWMTKRTTRADPWATPVEVLELSLVGTSDGYPTLSSDGLQILFSRGAQIYESSRPNRTSAWNAPTPVTGLDAGIPNKPGSVYAGGLRIVFEGEPAANRDLFVASRATTTAPWSNVAPLAEINTAVDDARPYVSPDGLTLYFHSTRGGTSEIWTATRATIDVPFGAPTALTGLGTGASPALTDDQRIIVFSRGFQLFTASR